MPETNPRENIRPAPESAPPPPDYYAELEKRAHAKESKRLVEMFNAEVTAGSISQDQAEETILKRMQEWKEKNHAIIETLKNINEDPGIAAEMAHTDGWLPDGDVSAIKELFGEIVWDRKGKQLAWKLTAENPNAEIPPNFVPSPEVKKSVVEFLIEQERVLQANQKRKGLQVRITELKRDIETLRGGRERAALAAKFAQLEWAENRMNALRLNEDLYTKKKEDLKAEIMLDFNKKKGEFITKNRKAFIEMHKASFNEALHRAPDHALTPDEEERLIKAVREREAIEHGARFVYNSVFAIDLAFEEEKKRHTIDTAPPEAPERTLFQRIRESWAKKSWIERTAISCAIAAGVGGAVAFAAPSLVGVWGLGWLTASAAKMGVVGTMGYRAGRAFTAAPIAAGLNAVAQKITGWIFGREGGKRKKLERELETAVRGAEVAQEERTMQELRNRVTGVGEWLTDRAKLLEMAKIIDNEVDGHRTRVAAIIAEKAKELEAQKQKERNVRMLVALLSGLGAGFGAGAAYDYAMGTIPEVPGGGGKVAPATAGVAGAPPVPGTPPAPGAAPWGAEFWEPSTDYSEGATAPGASAGGAPGTGELAPSSEAAAYEYERAWQGTEQGVPGAGRGAGAAAVAGVAEAVPAGPKVTMLEGVAPDIMHAKAGDTIWRMTSEQLSQRFPKEWADFTPQQRNNLIANFIEKHGEKGFNLADFRKMPIGHEVDFKKLFGSTDIQHLFDHARGIRGGGGIASAAAEAVGGAPVKSGIAEAAAKMDQFARDMELWKSQIGQGTASPAEILERMRGFQAEMDTLQNQGIKISGGRALEELALALAKGEAIDMAEVSAKIDEVAREIGVKPAVPEFWEPSGDYTEGVEEASGKSYTIKSQAPETPTPEAPAAITPFGTAMESSVAKAVGFSAEQYKAIKDATVGQLLTEIPVDDPDKLNDMWKNFGQRNPPNLPKFTSWNEGWEMQRRVGLADHIRKNLGISADEFRKLKTSTVKIGDFLNEIARRGT